MDKKINSKTKRKIGHLVFFIVFPLICFVFWWFSFKYIVGNFHFWFGIFWSLCSFAMAIGTMVRIIRYMRTERIENNEPIVNLIGNISASVASVLILTTAFAYVSFILCKLNLVTITNYSSIPEYDQIVKTYIWHLINIIPFTNVEKTFGMKNPAVQFTGWAAGTPIFVFRILVIVIIFSIIRESWSIFREGPQKDQSEKLQCLPKTKINTHEPTPNKANSADAKKQRG